MAAKFNGVYRSPGVYITETDMSPVNLFTTRSERKALVKELLKNDYELLSEIVLELRQEKIMKIKNEI